MNTRRLSALTALALTAALGVSACTTQEESAAPADTATATATVTVTESATPAETTEPAGEYGSADLLRRLIEEVPTVRAMKDGIGNPVLHEMHVRELQSADRPFTVLSTHSAWLLPSLVLQTRAIDLERAAAEVRDYANPGALLRAVANGTCAAAGVSRADYDALAPLNGVTVIAETVDMPYGVLMVPLEVGLGVRLALAEHLPALAAHPRAGRALHLLLGQAALVPIEPGDLAELDAFMQSTGLDFAQLGD